ncbi:MAG: hypothetical protein AB8I08_32625 [Sandaracinaceae bacterium]
MMRMGWITLLALAVGCAAGTPDTAIEEASVELEATAEREAWEAAAPGCEDVRGDDLRLVTCEGESELGCVIDGAGAVLCVDALDLLVEEVSPFALAGYTSDPSPQPSVVAHQASLGPRRDPTPTPLVRAQRADPTPTPLTEADTDPEHDPTPTPMMEP